MEYTNIKTLGYKFATVEQAEVSRKIVNDVFVCETSTTTEFASIITCAKFGKNYIINQEYMNSLLGAPTEIEYFIPKPSPFNP